MIYLCKGCSAGCDGINKLIGSSCRLCGSACGLFGKSCSCVTGACNTACATLTTALDRPLGLYVLGTFLLNVPAGICALMAAIDKEMQACTENHLRIVCVADVLLAALHCGMALYIQRRLVR